MVSINSVFTCNRSNRCRCRCPWQRDRSWCPSFCLLGVDQELGDGHISGCSQKKKNGTFGKEKRNWKFFRMRRLFFYTEVAQGIFSELSEDFIFLLRMWSVLVFFGAVSFKHGQRFLFAIHSYLFGICFTNLRKTNLFSGIKSDSYHANHSEHTNCDQVCPNSFHRAL